MPSRVWLDATTDEAAESVRQTLAAQDRYLDASSSTSPAAAAGAPTIPVRHSPALSSSSRDPGSRSQQSSRTRHRHSRRTHTSRSPKIDEKQPEVIGTLIDSLSTISFPDPIGGERAVASIPHAERYGRSPNPSLSTSSPRLRHSRSFDTGDYTAIRTALDGQLHVIDDAAEPPVVRTSKGSSHRNSPAQSKLNRYGLQLNGGLGISNGLESPTGYMSRGNVSIQSIASQDAPRSPNSPLNVKPRRSSAINPSVETFDPSFSPTKRAFRWTPQRSSSKSKGPHHVAEDRNSGVELRFDALEQADRADQRASATRKQPRINGNSPSLRSKGYTSPALSSNKEGKMPASTSRLSPALAQNGPTVPNRRSSLRPYDFADFNLSLEELTPFAPENKKESPRPKTAVFEAPSARDKAAKTTTGLDLLNGHDTEVTKRIKELKAKKEERDREARASPTPDAQTTTVISNVVVVKGDSATNGARRRPANLEPIHVERQSAQAESTNDRPSTPLTPTALPIDYSFIVESLSRPKPLQTTQSVPADAPQPLTTRPQSVGALMRSTINKAPSTKSFFARKETVRRADTPDRSSIDSVPLDAKASSRRSASIASRRKRWSQTDLSSIFDTKSRDVHQQQTLLEERPSSQDAIGRAVDRFIHAQRLSQKIRHPTTGRVISFSEVGNPKGHVVFCCVGMGLTRYVTAFYDELANTLNLRIITPDRPGVGDSEADPIGTPLSWPDDILLICNALNIHKFSLLAHSAGAIYALATALRVPQHIRGQVHLLAPWIPPSQMETIGTHKDPPPGGAQLPKSQRFLRALPAPLLKVANSSFLSATSASISPKLGSPAGRKKKKSPVTKPDLSSKNISGPVRPAHTRMESIMLMDQQSMPRASNGMAHPNGTATNDTAESDLPSRGPVIAPRSGSLHQTSGHHMRSASAPLSPIKDSFSELGSPLGNDPALRKQYDERLTMTIWNAATTSANPAVDLLVCLERSQTIGFRYVDITRAVVVHHGSKDSRVPVENVKWLGGMMRRCEVRVLEGESHGLMASASVMGAVLTEMAKEWQEWEKLESKGRI